MGEGTQGWLPLGLDCVSAAVWSEKLHTESQPTFRRHFSLKLLSMIQRVVVLRQLNSLFFSDNIKCSNAVFFLFISLPTLSSLANRTLKSLLITNNMGFHSLLEQVKFLWRLNSAQIDFNEGNITLPWANSLPLLFQGFCSHFLTTQRTLKFSTVFEHCVPFPQNFVYSL